jgi:hypothetical protein
VRQSVSRGPCPGVQLGQYRAVSVRLHAEYLSLCFA